MTRRESDLDLRLFYSGNVTSYCPGTSPLQAAPCTGRTAVTPALAAPPTITGVETSFSAGTLTFKVRVIGELVAGIQDVWVTWTIPPAAGNTGTWASVDDLVQDPDDPSLWTGTLSGISNPSAVHFFVQAVNGVGKVTLDNNLGAFYRPGSIPGPPDPNLPPPVATGLAFEPVPPVGTVEYSDTFSVTARLTVGTSPLAGKRVLVGLGGAGIPVTTGADGRVTVPVRAALTPGVHRLTASFAGDATHAGSGTGANVTVVAQPTSLTLSGTFGAQTTGSALSIVAALKDTNVPPAALHGSTVFLLFNATGGGGANRVYQGKTDPQGRVEFSSSTLASLPTGNYDVDAYFNGVPPLGIAQDDVDYGPSSDLNKALSLSRGIVFASLRSGFGDIYSVNPAGGSPIQITSGNAIDAEPEWSPGADKVVFSSTREGNVELYVTDRDGSDITRLTTNSAIDTSPAWSPNGLKIAFASNRGGNWDIYVMNADGTGTATRLTTSSSEDLLPAWSPDSSSIAFMSRRTGDGDIYTLTASNPSTQVRRTNSSSVDSEPAWSGGTVAFSTNRHGSSNFELYTMTFPTPTGLGNQTRRTNQTGHDITPAWSPDGSKLALASNRSPGGGLNFNIYTMNANGSGTAQSVVIHSAADIFPDW